MSPAARTQLALVNTAISFALGLLAGYVIRDFFSRLRRQRAGKQKQKQKQNNADHRVEAQRQQQQHQRDKSANSRATTTTAASMEESREGVLEEEADGAGRSVVNIPKCQSSEDIFFDAPCDSAFADDNIPATMSGTGSSDESATTTTTTIDKQLLYAQVDHQLKNSSSSAELVQTAIKTLKEHEATLSDDANYWWRRSQATFFLSKADDPESSRPLLSESARKALLTEAMEHAQRALDLDAENAEAHKWYAIGAGALGDLTSSFNFHSKVKKGRTFKKHLDLALSLKLKAGHPEDPTLLHLRGRFYLELLGRSQLEQKIARQLIADIPEGVSQEHALADFLHAHRLRSAWKENLLYLSQALVALGRHAEAAPFISEGLALPVATTDESLAHTKLNELSGKCNKKK